MAEIKLEAEQNYYSEESDIKEEPGSSFHIKEEPQELPFHIIKVKIEEDQDNASVLHQKEETHSDQSDTDLSEDYSQEQAPKNKRSYEVIPPDSCATDQRPFSCSECGKNFKNKINLQGHISSVHRGERPHKCLDCEKHFTKKSALSLHRSRVHHICTICPERFSDRASLNEHLKGHVEAGTLSQSSVLVREANKDLSCPECDKTFSRDENLKTHLLVHSGETPFKCSVCQKGYALKGSLSRHFEKVHLKKSKPRLFSCSECGRMLSCKAELKRHIAVHKGERPHQCPVCEKSFCLKFSLNKHIKTHSGEKTFVCTVCEKGFVTNSSLSRHQSIIHHICPVCSEHFSEKESLKGHLNCHVEDGTLDPSSVFYRETVNSFTCSECEQSFRYKSDLQRHELSIHRGEKCHKCSVCKKSFTRKGVLKVHMKTHTREEAFVCTVCKAGFVEKEKLSLHRSQVHHICQVCSESFTGEKSLNEHLDLHVKEGTLSLSSVICSETVKPFNCSECKKSFKTELNLQRHESSVHRGEKCDPCTVCHRRFSLKSLLDDHMRTHTGEKPFACPICRRRFTQKCNLRKHMWTHPGDKPQCPVCRKSLKSKYLPYHLKRFHFICPDCKKQFAGKKELEDHLKSHGEEVKDMEPGESFKTMPNSVQKQERTQTGNKRRCPVCEKSLVKNYLPEHLKLFHFTCPDCNKQFLDKSDLDSHLRTHREEEEVKARKPFSCSDCGRRFTLKNNFESHRKTHRGARTRTQDLKPLAPRPVLNQGALLVPSDEGSPQISYLKSN